MLRMGVPVVLAMLALLVGHGGVGKPASSRPAAPVTHHEQPIGLQFVLHSRRIHAKTP
jgi:hypothetical protein